MMADLKDEDRDKQKSFELASCSLQERKKGVEG